MADAGRRRSRGAALQRAALAALAALQPLPGLRSVSIGVLGIGRCRPHPRDRNSHGPRRHAARRAGSTCRGKRSASSSWHRRRHRRRFATTRMLESMLFGTSPTDPLVFAGAVLVLVVAALVASFIPARRAALLDP